MLELGAAGVALVGRALLQAADAAILAVGEDEMRAAGSRSPVHVRLLLDLKKSPEPTATALRAASSFLLAFAAVACAIVMGDLLSRAGVVHVGSRSTLQLLAGLVAGGMALLLDLAPRSLAAANPIAWGIALARPAWLVCKILGPFVRVLLKLFDALLLRQGATARYTPPPPPLEEIEKILSDEAREGTPGAPSPELVHGLFKFAERTVKEIMVPRTAVIGVPIDASADDVIALLSEEGHTRMPVFEGDLDHIKGVLHTKDVIPLLANPELIVLQDLLRPAIFVPWNKPVGELLREMQLKRSHIAMVIDEYGGLSGLVSLEDILAEIVGELSEQDEERVVLRLGADGSALLPAETRIDEVNQALGSALPEGDFETLAGLLNSCAGAIPQPGDSFFVGGLELTVAQRDDRRVLQVRVVRAQTVPPPARA